MAKMVKDILEDNDINVVLLDKQDSIYLFGDIELYVTPDNVILAKFSIKSPDTAIMTIDSEACPNAMTIAKVERVPTLVIVKAGKIVANKVGLMNPKELLALYASV